MTITPQIRLDYGVAHFGYAHGDVNKQIRCVGVTPDIWDAIVHYCANERYVEAIALINRFKEDE